jgi:hypothetical protein
MIRAKRSNVNIFDVDVMPLDDEEARITITGNFSPKLLRNFQEQMTCKELSSTFELS